MTAQNAPGATKPSETGSRATKTASGPTAPPGAVADAVDRAQTKPPFAAALVAALSELTNVVRDLTAKVEMKQGGTYTYQYADLGSLLADVRPKLARHGIAISQDVTTEGNSVTVETTLLHVSGESRTSKPLTLPGGGAPQSIGSAITYARRYQLTAMLGLGAEDDDGQAAAHEVQARKSASRRPDRAVVTKPPAADEKRKPWERIAAKYGVTPGKLLVDARNLAVSTNVDLPDKVEDITQELLEGLVEVYEQALKDEPPL